MGGAWVTKWKEIWVDGRKKEGRRPGETTSGSNFKTEELENVLV